MATSPQTVTLRLCRPHSASSSHSGFAAAVLGRKPPTADAADGSGLIEVDFSPKPDNCDIEINGKYVGGSPLKRAASRVAKN